MDSVLNLGNNFYKFIPGEFETSLESFIIKISEPFTYYRDLNGIKIEIPGYVIDCTTHNFYDLSGEFKGNWVIIKDSLFTLKNRILHNSWESKCIKKLAIMITDLDIAYNIQAFIQNNLYDKNIIQRVLDNMSGLDNELVVFRGITEKLDLRKMKRSFISTSLLQTEAEWFSDYILLRLLLPKGLKVLPIYLFTTEFSKETEVLLPPGLDCEILESSLDYLTIGVIL